jgi:hypothetical protein
MVPSFLPDPARVLCFNIPNHYFFERHTMIKLVTLLVLVGALAMGCRTRSGKSSKSYRTGVERYEGQSKEETLQNSAFKNPDKEDSADTSLSLLGNDEDDQGSKQSPNQSPNQAPAPEKPMKGDDTGGKGDDGGKGGDDGGGDPEPETPQCEDTLMPVSRLCSNKAARAAGKWRAHWGQTLKGSYDSYTIRLLKKGTQEIAHEFTETFLIAGVSESILKNGSFNLNFAGIADGDYDIVMCANTELNNCKVMNGRKLGSGTVSIASCVGTPGVTTVLVGPARPGSVNNIPIPCDKTASPLVIDLANKGVTLSHPKEGVLFDIDADGSKEQISWPLDSLSVFVALDVNGNGTIDDASELFGNNSKTPDGKPVENGFLALAKYDSNGDGFIDSKDPAFSKLRVWFDQNRNGSGEASELNSLAKSSIARIDLSYTRGFEVDDFGNETRERSVVTMTDGSLRQVFDIWFLPFRF